MASNVTERISEGNRVQILNKKMVFKGNTGAESAATELNQHDIA